MKKLTQERLRELLSYDPSTGIFRWRIKRKKMNPGDIAGSRRANGYWCIKIDYFGYQAHRLAWLYVYGKFPDDEIDHIHGSRADNRILELREATHAKNGMNRKMNSNNSSGFRGVSWHKQNKEWRAQIRHNFRIIYLGGFQTKQMASLAYEAKATELFGEFKRVS
jgi:HNH endonuclease